MPTVPKMINKNVMDIQLFLILTKSKYDTRISATPTKSTITFFALRFMSKENNECDYIP
jgi:hypothetical protein